MQSYSKAGIHPKRSYLVGTGLAPLDIVGVINAWCGHVLQPSSIYVLYDCLSP